MILTHPYTYKDLSRVDGAHGRCYNVGTDRPLPSVTTILSSTEDKSFLVEWRQRVGDAEADRVVEAATRIGNGLHDNLEQYILTNKEPTGNYLTKTLTNLVIKNGLSKVDEVWGTEVPLYCTELYAGTTDLVGVHEGTPAIMDFKNSSKDKKKEYIESYFLQLAAYAEAHNSMFGTAIKKGVIMMACHSGNYAEFIIEGDEFAHYVELWYNRVFAFYDSTYHK